MTERRSRLAALFQRAAVLPAAVMSLWACGGGGEASCSIEWVFEGRSYVESGVPADYQVVYGEPLGTAVRAPCPDPHGDEPVGELKGEVFRVDGFDPAVVIGDPGQPNRIYVELGRSELCASETGQPSSTWAEYLDCLRSDGGWAHNRDGDAYQPEIARTQSGVRGRRPGRAPSGPSARPLTTARTPRGGRATSGRCRCAWRTRRRLARARAR